MASLLPKDGRIFNCADQAPAPSKDYCQVVVSHQQVIFRWWKITLRKTEQNKPGGPAPGEVKETHEDFMDDDRIQHDITRVFGKNTLEYVKRLAQGQIDYLPRMPNDLLIQIILRLDLEDIARLSQVSKQFRELCHSNELWEKLYIDHVGSHHITEELKSLAEAIGWRKLFFTNKLQLQVQLRRLGKQRSREDSVEEAKDGVAFLTLEEED